VRLLNALAKEVKAVENSVDNLVKSFTVIVAI